jgi:lipopolysaccharide transport system ATP-binding protein
MSIISVENLSKQYRIGTKLPYKTFRETLMNAIASPRLFRKNSVSDDNAIWALKDVSFEVQQGEVLGIIGRNGAGKSTLLRILSRVTEPTKGEVKMQGRVGSLLEVGTGFHPELTGRENIFLNGAILGMRKEEIKKKFDEIAAFAEIDKFLDTPVKRYSSGMYVRLAFAVAAHLEPEILLVDEVLAVGDAQFQKKCLGKMGDVAREGRTVLFVSHNMTAIKTLCSKSILLKNGSIDRYGETNTVVDSYLSTSASVLIQVWDAPETAPGNEEVKVKRIELIPQFKNGSQNITVETPLNIEFQFWYLKTKSSLINVSMHLYNVNGELIFATGSPQVDLQPGLSKFTCHIPGDFLNDGIYKISMMIVKDSTSIFMLNDGLIFEMKDSERKANWFGKWPGVVRPKFEWNVASS